MERINRAVTGNFEKSVLAWSCKQMPAWVTSDMLTALGFIGATLSFAGFWLSSNTSSWLWLAIAGLVLNWAGDSLDGSLARYRKTERPQYGFFLDHMIDAFSLGLVAIGIGLSPYVLMATALAALARYFMVVILSMATFITTGTFRISFGGFGPTEVRLLIAFCAASAIFFDVPNFPLCGISVSLGDIIVAILTGLLFITGIISMIQTAQALAAVDPPKY
jgi:phosphatidylglycerophosphate synthase